jgi:acetolactate synthase-1/2/3 large subunit
VEKVGPPVNSTAPDTVRGLVAAAAARIKKAVRPVILVGSQAILEAPSASHVARALEKLGVPVYLSGMARGLLGAKHPLLFRHKRREALREADLVILAGVPCDFRLDYGRHIRHSTFLISVNRSREDRNKNRRPSLGIPGDPGRFLRQLSEGVAADNGILGPWLEKLRGRDGDREREIDKMAAEPNPQLNPVQVCREIEGAVADDSMLIVDGGDFVGTASYIVSPRKPLSWLDPGVFGTLGVGAGFALGAKLVRPESEVWIIYGDGSLAYSLAEFDTFARHKLPVIAVVGNDGSWAQIARDQIEILKDDVGTVLRQSDYHIAAEGYGGRGLVIRNPSEVRSVLAEAKAIARAGQPVLVNALIGKTEFRKGSISM